MGEIPASHRELFPGACSPHHLPSDFRRPQRRRRPAMPTPFRVPPVPGRLLVLAAALIALPAAAADGTAYVSNQQGDVSVIDLSNWQVTGTIPSYGGEPRGIGLTADGKWLVVANRADGG